MLGSDTGHICCCSYPSRGRQIDMLHANDRSVLPRLRAVGIGNDVVSLWLWRLGMIVMLGSSLIADEATKLVGTNRGIGIMLRGFPTWF